MITQEELKELIHYDPESGVFKYIKTTRGRVKKGSVAGKIDTRKYGTNYWAITINYKYYMAHRLAWLYVHGQFPDYEIDHIDGNGLNNKLINLRSVTAKENSMNKRKYVTNKSGITGVCWDKKKKKWEVQIQVDSKNKRIGRFNNLLDAACARMNANIRYGYHCNHGSDRPI